MKTFSEKLTDSAAPMKRVSIPVSEHAAFREMVKLTSRNLRADLCNGLVGAHHNTFQHRSRVLRQLTAELAAMEREWADRTRS